MNATIIMENSDRIEVELSRDDVPGVLVVTGDVEKLEEAVKEPAVLLQREGGETMRVTIDLIHGQFQIRKA